MTRINEYVVAKHGGFKIDIQRADLPHVKADQTITKERIDLRKKYGAITGYYNPK